MRGRPLSRKGPLENGTATHCSFLAWRIPWTEESGGLQSMGSQSQTRLKRLSMHACTHAHVHGRKAGPQPGPRLSPHHLRMV